jgi:hypothetical protein
MDEKKEKTYTIIVNLEEKKEARETLAFENVLDIAFPPPRTIPDNEYSITFKNAKSEPHSGQLRIGGTVEIKNGTQFDVTPTNKS